MFKILSNFSTKKDLKDKEKTPKLTRSFFSVALVTKEIEMPRVSNCP